MLTYKKMYSSTKQSKILLMGPHNGGKTSMRSVIFSNYTPRDTRRIAATIQSQRTQLKFLGNFVLSMWDCGGQVHYLDSYLKAQRQFTFSNVAVLIFAVDISMLWGDNGDSTGSDYYGPDNEGGEWSKTTILQYLREIIAALQEHSPDAAVYILLHKADLIPPIDRRGVVQQLEEEVRAAIQTQSIGSSFSTPSPLPVSVGSFQSPLHDHEHFILGAADRNSICHNNIFIHATSIWDESLNDAWSAVFQRLVPNAQRLHSALRDLVHRTDAAEATVFDRSTFLAISRVRQVTCVHETSHQRFTYLDGPDGTSHHRQIIFFEDGREPQHVECDPSTIPPPVVEDKSSAHLSNVFKYFKNACVKATGAEFGELMLVTEDRTIVLQGLTANTVVMLAMRGVGPALVKRNLAIFKAKFARTMELLETGGSEGFSI